MNKDSIVLSYDESLLRKSDLELLKGPHWLNDNIISFYFEYLKNTIKKKSKHNHLLFIAPEVTQCIKIAPANQLEIFLEPLNIESKRYIFLALNNNETPQFAGGSHWSLLLYARPNQTIYHFDSMHGTNSYQAEQLARKLFDYFDVSGVFVDEPVMQQSNGYDCGIYLISYAEYLSKYLSEHGQYRNINLNNDYIGEMAQNMRMQIINLIEQLKT